MEECPYIKDISESFDAMNVGIIDEERDDNDFYVNEITTEVDGHGMVLEQQSRCVKPSYAAIARKNATLSIAPINDVVYKQRPWTMRPIVIKPVTQKERVRPETSVVDPFDNAEEDGLNDMIFNLLDNKASVNLTRSRACDNLTPKQMEIKAIRIASK